MRRRWERQSRRGGLVPGNLVASVPPQVDPVSAAFTTIGSIALQGLRRAEMTLGERSVVLGLGLLGLITVQLLCANGCQVLGVEPLEARRELARELGAELTLAPADAREAVASWDRRSGG